jgi:hypothetical protein
LFGDLPFCREESLGRPVRGTVVEPTVQLAEHYPRLKPHLGPATCSEDSAIRNPAALLFNRSG